MDPANFVKMPEKKGDPQRCAFNETGTYYEKQT